jgi:hypothetical protein
MVAGVRQGGRLISDFRNRRNVVFGRRGAGQDEKNQDSPMEGFMPTFHDAIPFTGSNSRSLSSTCLLLALRRGPQSPAQTIGSSDDNDQPRRRMSPTEIRESNSSRESILIAGN